MERNESLRTYLSRKLESVPVGAVPPSNAACIFLTDAEWRVIAAHLPKPCATGRPREWPMREIVNGIFYVMRAGCPCRLMPNDLPPWETIYRWFAVWRDDGRFERINANKKSVVSKERGLIESDMSDFSADENPLT